MNKSESKYFHTAARMDEALLDLLGKKDFEYITVREICVAAGVNRSTFYLHYENTRDLLDEAIAYMQKQFMSYFDTTDKQFFSRMQDLPPEELILITPAYLTPYLTFIRDHRRVYAAAMERPASFRSEEAYGAMFRHIFDPILTRFSVPAEKRPYIMAYYLGGISAVVAAWIRDDCRPSTDFIGRLLLDYILPEKYRQGN